MRVVLRPHDPSWRILFEAERARIAEALGSEAISIDHFGSTAIGGLAAKPIVDILVARAQSAEFERWSQKLRPLGYVRARVDSTDQNEGQWFFRDEPRTRHVHVYPAGTRAHRRHLAFRDALRADPALREEYAALKRDLAAREWASTQDYADAKSAFVRRVEKGALGE